MFFFEGPAERAFVVGEHTLDTLVLHIFILQLFFQELVLFPDLFLVAHDIRLENDKENCLDVRGRPSS